MSKLIFATLLSLGAAAAGCGDDGNQATPDSAAPTLCQTYCETMDTNCTGANAQYLDTADCVSYCEGASWPEGDTNAQDGNSLNCRIYHGGAPAAMNATLHCPHAGPEGDGVCGSANFRTDAPGAYTPVDGMGMPAVSTALVPSASKNAYNDAAPDSAAFVNDFVATLTALHAALDANLVTLGLTPCSMATATTCVSQEYAAGASVASLVVPDSLAVNPAATAGFPNGRKLADQVIDVTLAVLLLKLDGGTCGGAPCSAATLAGLPLNPPMNDVAFPAEFPYVAPAHQP